jgi:hypothetical protein
MKSKKGILIVLSVMVAILLTACMNVETNPVAQPPIDESDGLPPVAAVKAREALAAELGISLDEVEIISQEQAEWTDSCLGLGGIAESCALVLVSGWRVELSANGETHIARTDELGESIRFEGITVAPPLGPVDDLAPDAPDAPDAAVRAREVLADFIGIDIEKIEIVSYEPAEWPDGCLGLGSPDTMCTMAIVPGWRVELNADGAVYIARTDEVGNAVRFE